MRIERSGAVEKGIWRGLQQAGGEAFADQAALAVASVAVEAVADHLAPVAHLVGDDGDEAGRHLGKIDVGVADRRGDRLGNLADIKDAHGAFQSWDAAVPAEITTLSRRLDPQTRAGQTWS
jgi:hypothetical protein